RALLSAIATACFCGYLPVAMSSRMFPLTTFRLDPDWRGILHPFDVRLGDARRLLGGQPHRLAELPAHAPARHDVAVRVAVRLRHGDALVELADDGVVIDHLDDGGAHHLAGQLDREDLALRWNDGSHLASLKRSGKVERHLVLHAVDSDLEEGLRGR